MNFLTQFITGGPMTWLHGRDDVWCFAEASAAITCQLAQMYKFRKNKRNPILCYMHICTDAYMHHLSQ